MNIYMERHAGKTKVTQMLLYQDGIKLDVNEMSEDDIDAFLDRQEEKTGSTFLRNYLQGIVTQFRSGMLDLITSIDVTRPSNSRKLEGTYQLSFDDHYILVFNTGTDTGRAVVNLRYHKSGFNFFKTPDVRTLAELRYVKIR